MRSYPSWIAGLRYRGPDGINRGKYCLRLRAGDPLDLIPEPENKYDPDAIAVKHSGCHLGYVPSRHHWVAEAIGEGHRLLCAVARMETEGWLFRRVSFVGIRISIDDDSRADARDTVVAKTIELRARDACIDGLRVLAYIAMADDMVTPEEVNLELSYVESRLAQTGIEHDAALTDAMLALSQGLIVTKRSFSRAINIVVSDREHFKLVLNVALETADLGDDPKNIKRNAMQRISKAGKAKGWT